MENQVTEMQASNPDNLSYQADSARRFSFMFAKRNGVLIESLGQNSAVVRYTPGISLDVMGEVQRFLGLTVEYLPMDEESFKAQLAVAYQNDSSESMQMVEGLGEDMDLASLADLVPQTEDLMEQEDDAPIIKLINAVLNEAVR